MIVLRAASSSSSSSSSSFARARFHALSRSLKREKRERSGLSSFFPTYTLNIVRFFAFVFSLLSFLSLSLSKPEERRKKKKEGKEKRTSSSSSGFSLSLSLSLLVVVVVVVHHRACLSFSVASERGIVCYSLFFFPVKICLVDNYFFSQRAVGICAHAISRERCLCRTTPLDASP